MEDITQSIIAFLKPESQAFLENNILKDPLKLALAAAKWPDLPIKVLAQQIEARQKLRIKLPSWTSNSKLYFPPSINREQASSEVTACYKSTIWPWYLAQQSTITQVIDLTLGLGIDALYYGKNHHLIGIEVNGELAGITDHNFRTLSKLIDLKVQTAESFLKAHAANSSDFFYLDPDRRPNLNQRNFDLDDCEPNAYTIVAGLVNTGCKIAVKCSPMLDHLLAIKKFPQVSEVLCISWKGDCRELIFAFDFNNQKPTTWRAVEISANETASEFSVQANLASEKPQLATTIGKYIYDPSPALNKLHLADQCAATYGLFKLHPNSYLYTSDNLIPNYIGRIFDFLGQVPIQKKKIQDYLLEYNSKLFSKASSHLMAHIATRNFPDRSENVRKQLGIKEGGSLQLFVTTLSPNNEKTILITKRVADES